MKQRILKILTLLALVCIYSPLEAKAPPLSRTTRPPDHYQVIVTNNLFRPLGWTRPTLGPTFELIATIIKVNGTNKALLRHRRNRKFHYVETGEELQTGVSVEKIESRSVTLNENGQSKVYRLKWG